jgi:hypothetical protein
MPYKVSLSVWLLRRRVFALSSKVTLKRFRDVNCDDNAKSYRNSNHGELGNYSMKTIKEASAWRVALEVKICSYSKAPTNPALHVWARARVRARPVAVGG